MKYFLQDLKYFCDQKTLTHAADSEGGGAGPAGGAPGGCALGLGVAGAGVPRARGAHPVLELDDLEHAENCGKDTVLKVSTNGNFNCRL